MVNRALVLALLIGAALGIPTGAQTIQFPQTVKTGHVSVVVPGDSMSREEATDGQSKRTQTSYHVSRSLDANITVSCIEYKSRDGVQQRPRLTSFLSQFIADHGSVDRLTSIQDDGRKGMDILTEVYHDRGQSRYSYVETRVFVDDTRLYAVTVSIEVTPQRELNTDAVTEIMSSMKVIK